METGDGWRVLECLCSAAAAVATVQSADSAVLFLAEMGPVKYTVYRVDRVYRVLVYSVPIPGAHTGAHTCQC